MSKQPEFDDARLQRMQQASHWLQRMSDTEDDPRVVESWLEWCQSDPRNQQAFDDIAVVWELGGRVEAQPQPRLAAAGMTIVRRRALAASLAGLGLALAGVWWFARPHAQEVLTTEFTSPVGVNTTQTLPDGSLLALGGGTRVSIIDGPDERRVRLHEGELYVTVKHEPARPFLVAVDGLEVIATGTEFDVLRTTARTVVTVADGSVVARYEGRRIELPGDVLRAGQQLVLADGSPRPVVRQVKVTDVIAWRSGLLSFDGEPLSEVISIVNRYSSRQVVIAGERVRTMPVIGTVRTDDIEDWLRALPHADFPVPVTIGQNADGTWVIAPSSAARSD